MLKCICAVSIRFACPPSGAVAGNTLRATQRTRGSSCCFNGPVTGVNHAGSAATITTAAQHWAGSQQAVRLADAEIGGNRFSDFGSPGCGQPHESAIAIDILIEGPNGRRFSELSAYHRILPARRSVPASGNGGGSRRFASDPAFPSLRGHTDRWRILVSRMQSHRLNGDSDGGPPPAQAVGGGHSDLPCD